MIFHHPATFSMNLCFTVSRKYCFAVRQMLNTVSILWVFFSSTFYHFLGLNLIYTVKTYFEMLQCTAAQTWPHLWRTWTTCLNYWLMASSSPTLTGTGVINRAGLLTNVVFSIVRRRLVLLGARFQMHNHLNEVDELKAQKRVSHRNKTNTHTVIVCSFYSQLLGKKQRSICLTWAPAGPDRSGTSTTCSRWTHTCTPPPAWTTSTSSGQISMPTIAQRLYAHCTDEFLSRKHGFLLSAMHSHTFRWFSAAPLVFLFLGFLPLQLNQIWRIFCVMYGEEGWCMDFLCLFAKTIYNCHVWMFFCYI